MLRTGKYTTTKCEHTVKEMDAGHRASSQLQHHSDWSHLSQLQAKAAKIQTAREGRCRKLVSEVKDIDLIKHGNNKISHIQVKNYQYTLLIG